MVPNSAETKKITLGDGNRADIKPIFLEDVTDEEFLWLKLQSEQIEPPQELRYNPKKKIVAITYGTRQPLLEHSNINSILNYGKIVNYIEELRQRLEERRDGWADRSP